MRWCRFLVAICGVVVFGGPYAVADELRPASEATRAETRGTPGPEGQQDPDPGYGSLLSAPDLVRKGKPLDGRPGREGTPVAQPAEPVR
jgi:hypothetical protein